MMRTIKTADLVGKRVFVHRPTKKDPDALKKLGRVRAFVFLPDSHICVGFLVKRPDAALMFRREDDFVGIDGFSVEDGNVIVGEDKADFGRGATRALAVPLERCVLWVGLIAVSESGQNLGYVEDVELDMPGGRVRAISVAKGAAANALLGKVKIPADMILGFRQGIGARLSDADPRRGGTDINRSDENAAENFGAILVSDAAGALEEAGGVAERAGEGAAKAAHAAFAVGKKAKDAAASAAHAVEEKAGPGAKAAAKSAGEAINKGAFITGRQIGRASGMFKGFKDNFEKAMKDDD